MDLCIILTPEVYLSIVLVDATRCIVNFEIEIWRDALESKSFQSIDKDEGIVRFDSQGIPKSECFQNLGWFIHKDGEIEKDMNHRIKIG